MPFVKISRKLPALVVCFMAATILCAQVEAMSTERSVRVRVKVYDNTTSIYSQDIEISQGEGTFIVPAILADSDVIALQVCCCLLSIHLFLFVIRIIERKQNTP